MMAEHSAEAGNDATVVRAGWVTKRGQVKKNWKRRYFVLRDDFTLSYYKDGSMYAKPAGVIAIDTNVRVIPGAELGKPHKWPEHTAQDTWLAVKTRERTYYLSCDSQEAAQGWLQKIKELANSGLTLAPASGSSPGPRKASAENQKGFQERLLTCLQKEENKFCFDCGSKGPSWASWNLGVFVCLQCAGFHRSLGTHISKVKSVNLDSWTEEQVAAVEKHGNGAKATEWEKTLPAGFARPTESAELEVFIKDKYIQKKYCGGSGSSVSAAPPASAPAPAAASSEAASNPFADKPAAAPAAAGSGGAAFNPFGEAPAAAATSGGGDTFQADFGEPAPATGAADPMAEHKWY
eukprot:m.35795 g.35795  ORF g.35795 m.35795 type:complete len:350 (-) comp10953_c0_seq1:277-1326(-)